MKPQKIILPPGCPEWITPELLDRTLHVWQPMYDRSLTVLDAVEIVRNMGALLEIVTGRT